MRQTLAGARTPAPERTPEVTDIHPVAKHSPVEERFPVGKVAGHSLEMARNLVADSPLQAADMPVDSLVVDIQPDNLAAHKPADSPVEGHNQADKHSLEQADNTLADTDTRPVDTDMDIPAAPDTVTAKFRAVGDCRTQEHH